MTKRKRKKKEKMIKKNLCQIMDSEPFKDYCKYILCNRQLNQVFFILEKQRAPTWLEKPKLFDVGTIVNKEVPHTINRALSKLPKGFEILHQSEKIRFNHNKFLREKKLFSSRKNKNVSMKRKFMRKYV